MHYLAPYKTRAWKASWNGGEITTLAVFDKSDPLDGPYFEEILYLTLSRLPGGAPGPHASGGGPGLPCGQLRGWFGPRGSMGQ